VLAGVSVCFIFPLLLADWGRGLVPHPNGREGKTYSTYVRVELFHTQTNKGWRSKTVKTKDVEGMGADVTWNEMFEWEFLEDPFAFVRWIISRVLSFGMLGADSMIGIHRFTVLEDEWKDDRIIVFCARLNHLQQGWNLVRMMDMKGKDSNAILLVRFEIKDISSHHHHHHVGLWNLVR